MECLPTLWGLPAYAVMFLASFGVFALFMLVAGIAIAIWAWSPNHYAMTPPPPPLPPRPPQPRDLETAARNQ